MTLLYCFLFLFVKYLYFRKAEKNFEQHAETQLPLHSAPNLQAAELLHWVLPPCWEIPSSPKCQGKKVVEPIYIIKKNIITGAACMQQLVISYQALCGVIFRISPQVQPLMWGVQPHSGAAPQQLLAAPCTRYRLAVVVGEVGLRAEGAVVTFPAPDQLILSNLRLAAGECELRCVVVVVAMVVAAVFVSVAVVVIAAFVVVVVNVVEVARYR